MKKSTCSMLMMWALCFSIMMSGCRCKGCGNEERESDRWKQKQETASTTLTPKDKAKLKNEKKAEKQFEGVKVFAGKQFNTFLPDDGTQGTKRVFKQEKEGYAEAEYSKDGKAVVRVSVSDIANNPKAILKFDAATEKVKGFPFMTRGKNSSMLLVKKRIQVKVMSKTLTPDERKVWLEHVELNGLNNLL